ncbi:MAG: hypothetical protein IT437_14160 [Phycisphaerales bacterium]|nr:hypothetical protein [Phycisphaerales bacterium]
MPVPGLFPTAEVHALCTWDPDGAGPTRPVVIAGGNFRASQGSPADFVAQWDGQSWQPMGNQVVAGGIDAVALYDHDGPGPAPARPVIGGYFMEISGQWFGRVARWDGAAWQPMGDGLGANLDNVASLVSYNGLLVAGGYFTVAGGQPCFGLAQWDGQDWSMFPDGARWVDALFVWNGDLISGSTPGVTRWDGKSWSFLTPQEHLDEVLALAEYRGDLIAGGTFHPPISVHSGIARFDGTAWRDLGLGTNGTVWALTTWDPDGMGAAPELLIAGGTFFEAGGVPAVGVAAWDGTQWSSLGSGLDGGVRALTTWDSSVIAGGGFVNAGGIFSPKFARFGCDDPCEPDCNGDGALTLADFGCFQTRFAVGNMQADCNRDGLLQLSDFGCFQTGFALGCP